MTKNENLLVVLAEECGELTQAISKYLRFGPDAYNPYDPHAISNERQLMIEYHQIRAVMDLILQRGILTDLDADDAEDVRKNKQKNVLKYEAMSERIGRITAEQTLEQKRTGSLREVAGDILSPPTDGRETIICHQVNCKGVMGAGLAKQIRIAFPEVYQVYYNQCLRIPPENLLGQILVVSVRNVAGLSVANIFGQLRYGRDRQYTDYGAIRNALHLLAGECPNAVIRIPYKMGCGLGGGDWNVVLDMIREELKDRDVEIWKLMTT